jgi:hypothetical protein
MTNHSNYDIIAQRGGVDERNNELFKRSREFRYQTAKQGAA